MLKATQKKRPIIYKGKTIRPTANFSTATLEARKHWNNVSKWLENYGQPRILNLAILSTVVWNKGLFKETKRIYH